MSKGGGETETNTVMEPWKAAQPYLKGGLDDVWGAYQSGLFDQPTWGGIRVAPQSSMTQAAQQGFFDTATGPNPVWGGGMHAFGQAVQGPDAGLGGLGTAQDMLGLYGNPMNTYGGLDTARSMVDRFSGDPQADLDQLKANTLADVVPAVSSRFANSGMLDSTMAADTMSRSAAEAVAPIEYGAWENAQNRALSAYQAAAPLEANQWNQAFGRGLSAFQTAAPMEQSAYEAARARQMQALGMTPELMSARYIDPQMLSAAGGMQDQYQQRILDSAIGNWYEEAGRPRQQLQDISSLFMGYGGMGGQETATQQEPGGSPLGGIIQALAGGLMLAQSDRRLKADVHRIGETAEGYPKYEFRYHWDAPGTLRVGVMADEVPEEITITDATGFKWVNYAEVTL